MKTFLVIAATLGLTSSMALADCAGHVTASKEVDKGLTTASITKAEEVRNEQAMVLKRDEAAKEAPATE
ncbi:hypothetical protein [Rhizobium sp. LCM 4573]|uniref:hypothetical protein n=1 Tax=Rhizobium sp. LCM 4573 TaxID=1848291 RepID=UPI0008D8E45C|nr:hypothetical protein [Rhizobium sp. LCM 4573]OHV79094.1 hypothetical protein LCM4573_07675 [Rhizobium sp. LCM 4573]